MKWATFLLLFFLTACSSVADYKTVKRPGYDQKPYLELAAGKQWVMRDARTGKLTTFTIGPAKQVGALEGLSYPLRISKTDVDSYWAPGQDSSIDYYLHQDADGTIWSPLSMVFAGNSGRITVTGAIAMAQSRPNEPRVDYILGPLAVPGQTVVTHYLYTDEGVAWPEGLWKSSYTLETVDTPAYRGEALCGRYSEGSDEVENNAEQWCFARGVGLVRLTDLHNHAAGIEYQGANSHVLELIDFR